MLLQNANSIGNYINDFFEYIYHNLQYINDFSIISTVTHNISTIRQRISIYRQKNINPFLIYTKRLLQTEQPLSLFLNRHNNPIHIVPGNFILLVCLARSLSYSQKLYNKKQYISYLRLQLKSLFPLLKTLNIPLV